MKELLSDHTGQLSSLRVMCFIAEFAAIGLAFTGHDQSVLVFIGCAFGSHVAQKKVELDGVKVDTDVKPE